MTKASRDTVGSPDSLGNWYIYEFNYFVIEQEEPYDGRLSRIPMSRDLKLQQTHFKPDKTFSIEHYLEERSKKIF
jgi:hypothetical protein